MNKTNLKLVPEYGATYAPRKSTQVAVEEFPARSTPRGTNVQSSSTVVVKGVYQSDDRGRAHVLVSMDPAAIERKRALRSAREGIEPTTSSAADSLFGILR